MTAPNKAAALAHYTGQARNLAKHVFTLRPSVQPSIAQIVTVIVEGAEHTVALDRDDEGPQVCVWIDAIQIGGKWHSAADVLTDTFIRALESQVLADMAADADADFEVPS